MEFFKRMQLKSKIWLLVGILIVCLFLVMAAGILEKDASENENSTQMESGEISETENVSGKTEKNVGNESKENSEKTEETSGEVSKTSDKNSKEDENTTHDSKTSKGDVENDADDSGKDTESIAVSNSEEVQTEDITCDEIARFSGQFVEDGKDELVENVAAIRVTNHTDRFLDLCTLKYEIDGKEATFIATGLPAGKSAWVLEKSKMAVSEDAEFTYKNCTTAFKDGVVASTNKISISSNGNMLTVVNNSKETLEGVYIYYKTLHTDGNYFGGITYLVDFGTLEPGDSVEKLAGHYDKEKTEIVRIGWQD